MSKQESSGLGVMLRVQSGRPAGASRIRTLGATPSLAGSPADRRLGPASSSHRAKFIAPVEAPAAVSYRSPRMPPLSFQAPPPRRLAVRRHFKPNGPRALSPHSGSRAVSQFAAL